MKPQKEKTCSVYFPIEDIRIKSTSGTVFKKILNEANIPMDYPCGGKGTCHKCKILLRPLGTDEPWVKALACKEKLNESVEVQIFKKVKSKNKGEKDKKVSLHIDEKNEDDLGGPNVLKTVFSLKAYDKGSESIQEQLIKALEDNNLCVNVGVETLRELAKLYNAGTENITIVTTGEKIIALEKGDTSQVCYGIAFDIGTTSVVGSLVDLITGETKKVVSKANGQKVYGADVISRISYTLEHDEGLQVLQRQILETLNDIIKELKESSGVEASLIYECSIVGNSTMSHLFLGVSPKSLAMAPYKGIFKYPPLVRAQDIGVAIHPKGILRVAPCIDGQVGGDTVAAVLDTRFLKNKALNLLVDIGTNGEIVFGSKKTGFITTSAAAGPAFEGAEILWGMRGINGAIEKVYMENDGLKLAVIDDEKPLGICGSGLVDAIALMLSEGVLSKSGTFIKADESALLKADIRKRITDKGFVLSFSHENEVGEDIVITKGDVRQLQLAKAGVLAAITLLKKELSITGKEIKQIILAGAFGSFINKESAVKIGLFPKGITADQIVVAGNAAGAGAKKLLYKKGVLEGEKIAKKIDFLDISIIKDFQNVFMDAIRFP